MTCMPGYHAAQWSSIKKLAAKGMTIDTVVGEVLKKERKPIGDTMMADWLKLAGAEG